jgi:hypothetical protein
VAGASCYNCIYSICDPEVWLREAYRGQPLLPMCANHPLWPGQLREVTGVPCRNYRPKPAVPQGDVRLIPLTEGLYTYVDAADYEWLSQWNWHITSGGYAARSGPGKQIFMHREIMQPPPGMVVDHADANKANNCRFNLRVCTRKQNQGNLPKQRGTHSRFKGVSYSKRHARCFAQCDFGGRHRWLGFFDNEVEAARAYDYAAVQECGEYARVNFPQEWPPERRRAVHAAYQAALKKASKKTRHKPKAKTNKKKVKANSNRKKANAKAKKNETKAKRKPSPARRKKKLPQRAQRTQRRRTE